MSNELKNNEKLSVLFVCMGNICRSPTAQGVFEHLVEQHALSGRLIIDSAGTHAYHVGNPPDPRAQTAALRRGIDLSGQRARRVTPEDFFNFHFILAMDRDNLADLREIEPEGHGSRLSLFLEYAPGLGYSEVPDPYYGGDSGFERVLDLIQAASEGLLSRLRRDHPGLA